MRVPIKVQWQQLCDSINKLEMEIAQTDFPIPTPQMCKFLIVGEDRRFYRHPGVDPFSLCRALWKTFFCDVRQGGSTIAMQFVRTMTGRYEKNWRRKFIEIFLAVHLMRYVSRDRLPILYLWVAYYGWKMNNFKQACLRLGINPESVSLFEAAKLVARLKYPEPQKCSPEHFRKIRRRGWHLMTLPIMNMKVLDSIRKVKMEPFEIKSPLRELVGHYPEPKELLKVACEGGELAQGIIARLWLSEGIPCVFRDCPAIYDSLRCWLGEGLKVDPKEIGLIGSARLGKSLAPKKLGKPFVNNESDLDLFVISIDLFGRLKKDFFDWACDFKSGKISPQGGKSRRYWNHNYNGVPRNIERGFIDGNKIPSRHAYPTAWKVQKSMENLVERLKNTPGAPKPVSASIRCFDSWSSFVKQKSLNLTQE